MSTIRALRKARGWTQFELALRANVQPQTVYFWESGRRTPLVPQLRKLGEIFEMCSDDIELLPLREAIGDEQVLSDEFPSPVIGR
ncbi:MAG TPA: helix-turn-helix transcriptional regulator [Bauldia sp.]|nr:helix-turn-helix transcriptional regulator [Bauldia sp.]